MKISRKLNDYEEIISYSLTEHENY